MATASERRSQVMTGDLPQDFLRLDGGVSTAQMAADEQAARALQQQLNPHAQAQAGAYYTGFIPPNTRGRLGITVVAAKLSKNYGLVRMDPYCRLRVGNTVFETPTDVSGGKSPKWHRTVHCYLPQGVDSIFLEVFDERAFTTDERIAWGHIPIPEAVFHMETIDDWYPLSGQQGEGKEGMVNLVMTFSTVDAPPVTYVPMSQPVVVIPGGAYPPVAVPGMVPGMPQVVQVPAQMPVRQGPLYTEQDVKEIQEMFPNMEAEVIKSVLEEKRGNKDAAVNALLSMAD